MKRKNLLIVCLLVALAAVVLALALLLPDRQGKAVTEDTAVILVDGREYLRVPLSQPQTVTLTQEDGSVNVIRVDTDGVVMESSTCDNQLCVDMGKVTPENWTYRPNGAFIICLPNRVSVELVVTE